MAAFGFFRKNSKLVFWIMVVLMVIFLIGIGGAQPIIEMFSRRGDGPVVGRTPEAELTLLDIQRADTELDILRQRLGIGRLERVLASDPILQQNLPAEQRIVGLPGEMGLVMVVMQPDPPLTWALLVQEAREMGIQVSDETVDGLLGQIGLDEQGLGRLIAQGRREGLTAGHIRGAVANYLAVTKAFELAGSPVPPSEPQLKRFYRDVAEDMTLAAVEFRAADLLDQVAEPTPETVQELFNQSRGVYPGQPNNPSPFGFGYAQPARVQLEYVFIPMNEVLDTVVVDETAMLRYWQEHRGELTRRVEVPATAPAEGATQPATQYAEVPIEEYYEAKPVIRDILRQQEAQRRIEEIAGRQLYQLSQRMQAQTQPAEGPSPLQALAEQDPVAGVDLQYRRTGLLTPNELVSDPVLGSAGQPGQSLAQVAFSVPPLLGENPTRQSVVDVGQLYGQPMDVVGPDGQSIGKILWRVVQATPPGAPESFTPEIRQQVVRDAKLMAAYQLALQRAQELLTQARQAGQLAPAAEAAGKSVQVVGPISRLAYAFPRLAEPQLRMTLQAAVFMLANPGQLPPELMPDPRLFQAVLATPPVVVGPPTVAAQESRMPLVPGTVADEFIESAFALAPASAETAPAGQAGPMKVIGVPEAQAAFVVQRTGFSPAYANNYDEARSTLLWLLLQEQLYQNTVVWYDSESVKQRVAYEVGTGE